jgi:hypothetical protein
MVKRPYVPNEYKLLSTTNFSPALQQPPIPRPLTKAVPLLRMSATAIAPSQLVLRRRRYRLPDQMPSFHRFKLWQGMKWTIKTDDPLLR